MSQRLSATEARLLARLAALAAAGAVCPTNGALAVDMGFSCHNMASAYLGHLERKGCLSIERTDTWRTLTLVETGAALAGPMNLQPKRGSIRAGARRCDEPPLPDPAQLASRDPCYHCGTRPEYAAESGCRHCRTPPPFALAAAQPFYRARLMAC